MPKNRRAKGAASQLPPAPIVQAADPETVAADAQIDEVIEAFVRGDPSLYPEVKRPLRPINQGSFAKMLARVSDPTPTLAGAEKLDATEQLPGCSAPEA